MYKINSLFPLLSGFDIGLLSGRRKKKNTSKKHRPVHARRHCLLTGRNDEKWGGIGLQTFLFKHNFGRNKFLHICPSKKTFAASPPKNKTSRFLLVQGHLEDIQPMLDQSNINASSQSCICRR